MDDITKLADAVADRLIGQCMVDLDQMTETVRDELKIDISVDQSLPYHAAIDQRCFCCDGCGWWCDTEELNNETSQDLCDDCNSE